LRRHAIAARHRQGTGLAASGAVIRMCSADWFILNDQLLREKAFNMPPGQ
jgi:hypothetical protein